MASSWLPSFALSSMVSGVNTSDIFGLLSREFVLQVPGKDSIEHRDDPGLRAVFEDLALGGPLDHRERYLADGFEGYRGELQRGYHQQAAADAHHRAVHPLQLEGLVELVHGERWPKDQVAAGVEKGQRGPRDPDPATLHAREQSLLQTLGLGDKTERGERGAHPAHRLADGATGLVVPHEDPLEELGDYLLHVVLGEERRDLHVRAFRDRQGYRRYDEVELLGRDPAQLEQRGVAYRPDLGERLLQPGGQHPGGGDAGGADNEGPPGGPPLPAVQRLVLAELRAPQVHGYVRDLFLGHLYLEGLLDGSGQVPGVVVLDRATKPQQNVFTHLDPRALQETLDHQRNVDAQVHEGAVGDRVGEPLDRPPDQGLDHPQPVLVHHPQEPVGDGVG